MDLNDLPKFTEMQEAKFTKMDAGKHTHLERTYAQLAKLGEEYGELCEQILAYDGHQRADKGDKFGPEKLASEFADIAVCLFVLGAHMNIDIADALQKKIAVINERFRDIEV